MWNGQQTASFFECVNYFTTRQKRGMLPLIYYYASATYNKRLEKTYAINFFKVIKVAEEAIMQALRY